MQSIAIADIVVEIRHLKSFLSVARLLSFHKAAGQLNYAQSSVSAQIKALEDELGVKLFDRLGRQVKLTEAGGTLFKYAQKMVALENETWAAFKRPEQLTGRLTLRIPETFGVHYLPGIVTAFRALHPQVELNFITCAREGLARDLRKGITDLAFLLDEGIHSADLESEWLSTEQVVLVAGADHPLARKKQVATEELNGLSLLLSKVDCSYRRLFETVFREAGIVMDTALGLNSVAAIKACLMNNLGISPLPRIAIQPETKQNTLKVIHWTEGPLEVGLLMIRYKERWISPTLEAFMHTCRHVMGGKLI